MTEPQQPKLGKVVVNRAMSVDGFIAGPGHSMRFGQGKRHPGEFVPWDQVVEVASETGAMLVGRRTHEVGSQMEAENPGTDDYPFNGSIFILTHRPLDPPAPGMHVLSGDIGEAVATALAAAGGKNLELLGADVAAQAFRAGLVDEVLVYVLPVVLGDGIPFSPAGSASVDLEPISSRRAGDVTVLRFRVKR